MKSVLKITMILMCFLGGYGIHSQDLGNYSLHSTEIVSQGEEMEIESNIIIEGNTLIWQQLNNGESNETQFEIINTMGSWNLQESNGQLIYTLSSSSRQIKFYLTGTGTDLTAYFDFQPDGEPYEHHFRDLSINYQ